jgi:nucleotide-binding universal stress UspA family protein
MGRVSRIVVATDFSAGSNAALQRGVRLAQAHQASLDLLHAFDIGAWHALRGLFDVARLAASAPPDVVMRDRLLALAESLKSQTGLEVSAQFGLGEPAVAIEAHARSKHADLVVLARRSQPDAPGAASTLLRVLHHAPCPVLVVRRGEVRDYGRVIAAVDLREVSRRAAAAAVQLFPQARHGLVHVLDRARTVEAWGDTIGAREIQVQLDRLQGKLQAQLDELARELAKGSSRTIDVAVLDATVARGLVEQAARQSADCLAVGRHGQGMLAERLLGSTALDLIHHTEADVLVVP